MSVDYHYGVTLEARISSFAREWRNDPRIRFHCREYTDISEERQFRWLQKIELDQSIKMFTICYNNIDVGVTGLTSLDLINRNAEFSLYIAPTYQHNGYAGMALRTLLSHGFYDIGLHRIWGEVYEGNPAMFLFGKVGFKEEGLLRDSYYRDGKFINSHRIGILHDEFRKLQPRR